MSEGFNREGFIKDRMGDFEFNEKLFRQLEQGEKDIESLPDNPELSKYLANINFKTLKTIFGEYRRQAGVDYNDFDFAERKDIKNINYGPLSTAYYVPSAKKILVDYQGLRVLTTKHKTFEERLTHVLVHQESHATSGSQIIIKKRPLSKRTDSGESIIINKLGSSRNFHGYARPDDISQTRLFHIINEGITEKVGRMAYNEYIAAEGLSFEPLSEAEEYFSPDEFHENDRFMPFSQKSAIELVNAICKRVAHVNDVSQQKSWEGMMRSWYENEPLGSKDFDPLWGGRFFL